MKSRPSFVLACLRGASVLLIMPDLVLSEESSVLDLASVLLDGRIYNSNFEGPSEIIVKHFKSNVELLNTSTKQDFTIDLLEDVPLHTIFVVNCADQRELIG